MIRKKKYFALVMVILMLVLSACGAPNSGTEPETVPSVNAPPVPVESVPAAPDTEPTEPEDLGLTFPYELENGGLVINSLFQSSVMNPDCNDEMGEDIASIELTNQSGLFLASAKVTITLDDDTLLYFEAADIPDGCTVWAFETSNAVIPEQPRCEAISCEAAYEAETPLMADQLEIEVEETAVTIRNLTDVELEDLCASFHCLFDVDLYFGGKTYTYPIETIPAGGEVSLEVTECYLGVAQAVRVAQENE